MAHSTTYRRRAKKIEATQAIEKRTKELVKIGDHYTDQDRKTADDLEATELWREFLASEM